MYDIIAFVFLEIKQDESLVRPESGFIVLEHLPTDFLIKCVKSITRNPHKYGPLHCTRTSGRHFRHRHNQPCFRHLDDSALPGDALAWYLQVRSVSASPQARRVCSSLLHLACCLHIQKVVGAEGVTQTQTLSIATHTMGLVQLTHLRSNFAAWQ